MKKFMMMYILVFSGLLYAASVEASLSSPEIVEGNIAQLKITAVGSKAAFPQITQIGDAKVIGRSQRQHNAITYINGKVHNEHSTSLIISFAPEHNITIPSYTVNVDGEMLKTKPLNLTVVKADRSIGQKTAANEAFFLSMKVNKSEVEVGEPLLLTVIFAVRDGVQITQDTEYTSPSFDGFVVKQLKDQRVYRQNEYQIQEIRYLLIPQKEGVYRIGPAMAKVGVADNRRRDMFGMFFNTKWSKIASNTVTVKVNPLPVEADLIGDFTVQSKIDHQKVKPNKPVNLTIEIRGKGNLDDFEISDYEIDGVTVYGDEPKVTTEVQGDHIFSRLEKHFVFISDHDFTIPSRVFSMYDPQTKKKSSLKIPSYKIKIIQAAGTQKNSSTNKDNTDAGIIHSNINQQVSHEKESQNERKSASGYVISPWGMIAAYMIGMLTMWLLFMLPWRRWFKKEYFFKEDEALKILYPHMSEDKKVEEMVRKLYAKKRGDKSIVVDKKELKEMIERFR